MESPKSEVEATRYVVNFMHRTGLLEQFQYVTPEDDDDEPTGLADLEEAKVLDCLTHEGITAPPSSPLSTPLTWPQRAWAKKMGLLM
ncbi:unnamed protein product [Penicillium viridicatum]